MYDNLELELKENLEVLESADYNDADNYQKVLTAYNKTETELNEAVENWENLELELEGIKSDL